LGRSRPSLDPPRRAWRLAGDRKQRFWDFTIPFREKAHDGRPDERLYFSTLPMNGRESPPHTPMAQA
jgi:hypothetical protein